MPKYLIVCPLEKELSHLVSALESHNIKFEKEKLGHRTLYCNKDLDLFLSSGGHGKVQFALNTQRLIDQIKNIDFVICAGSCGALHDDVQVFDVIAASETIEHDFTEKFDTKAKLPRFKGSEILLEKLKSFSNSENLKLRFGPIASGDEDIVSEQRSLELYEKTKALAVAWEGAGGARASLMNQIAFLELRAVTDNAKHDVANNFIKNLPKTMSQLASVLVFLLHSDNQ